MQVFILYENYVNGYKGWKIDAKKKRRKKQKNFKEVQEKSILF